MHIASAKSIIIEGNTFLNNIGLHGGALHIVTAPDYNLTSERNILDLFFNNEVEYESPLILIKDNVFESNIAYFEGNAIFIKDHYLPDT